MSDTNICEACGQPKLLPIAMHSCAGCGKSLSEGGRMVKISGVCTAYCFGCAPAIAADTKRVEGALL